MNYFLDLLRPRSGRRHLQQDMKPDIQKYLQFVDHLDLSEEEKTELIHTVWSIMEAFVDHAFGLHPSQQLPGAEFAKVAAAHSELINSDDQSSQQEL